ncbi:hypothetical protein Flexsi_1742 [Flexistipes sinusarabici DSM 4947]|uniref:Type 4 fimbrial biogenesis protein PilX N-terminal domain-containing protein n=1 Tax=Flexistipes sinusarabici (strain ATCC 49648 / DSM 4947 / MAS 10) TaxID=717231 RepID=F8E9X3_FLESM|nr:hypothetical protein [Flexistipes sinusarabici]AEI15384.1 hypothetical protein Flexsi_1742 [Flexistipes sinusarabici DSM 4947]
MINNNKGFSLLLAVFLLVVFGFIGVSIITMLSNQSVNSSEELISAQAFHLAESGVEWGIRESIDNGSCNNISGELRIKNQSGYATVNVRKISDNISSQPPANYSELCEVTSTGQINGIKRKLKVKFKR